MPVYIPALVVPPPSSLRSSPGPGQSELGPSLSSPPPAERVWPGWGGAEGRHPGYIRENCETCERGYAGILLVRIPDRGYKALQVITNKENEDKNIFYRAGQYSRVVIKYTTNASIARVLRGLAELEMAPGDETGEWLTARGPVPGLLLRNAE